jgi:Uma2 family endonuclease
MDDITYLSRPRPPMPPMRKLTFEEFLSEFDGQHAEWRTDGTVEILPEETMTHIQLRLDLAELLDVYLHATGWGHQLSRFLQRPSPTLPVRQPDIMIVANDRLELILQSCFYGPADIVIEIVSPPSVGSDYGAKFYEYESGGIQEYWIIDPERRIADVHERAANGKFKRRKLDANDQIVSRVLPQFSLDPAVLWSGEQLTNTQNLNIVAKMLGVEVDSLLK